MQRDIDVFAGKKIEVPLLYITRTKDWLIYQHPGPIDRRGGPALIFAV